MLWEIWMALAVLVGSLLVVASLPRRHEPPTEADLQARGATAEDRSSTELSGVRRAPAGEEGRPNRA